MSASTAAQANSPACRKNGRSCCKRTAFRSRSRWHILRLSSTLSLSTKMLRSKSTCSRVQSMTTCGRSLATHLCEIILAQCRRPYSIITNISCTHAWHRVLQRKMHRTSRRLERIVKRPCQLARQVSAIPRRRCLKRQACTNIYHNRQDSRLLCRTSSIGPCQRVSLPARLANTKLLRPWCAPHLSVRQRHRSLRQCSSLQRHPLLRPYLTQVFHCPYRELHQSRRMASSPPGHRQLSLQLGLTQPAFTQPTRRSHLTSNRNRQGIISSRRAASLPLYLEDAARQDRPKMR